MLWILLSGLLCVVVALWWSVKRRYMRVCNLRGRSLKGRVILLTGGTDGIGRAIIPTLIKLRADKVVFVGRDKAKAKSVVDEVLAMVSEQVSRSKSGDNIAYWNNCYGDLKRGNWSEEGTVFNSKQLNFFRVDLADLDDIDKLVAKLGPNTLPKIDILINNAGGLNHKRVLSKQGIDETFASNYLGHVWLTDRLIPRLSEHARIINLSSCMHWMTLPLPKDVVISFDDPQRLKTPYDYWMQYSVSKLAVNLGTKASEIYFKNAKKDIKTVSMFPGIVYTAFPRGLSPALLLLGPIAKRLVPIIFNSLSESVQTLLDLTTCDHGELVNGAYYWNCRVAAENSFVESKSNVERFWKYTLDLLRSVRPDQKMNFSEI